MSPMLPQFLSVALPIVAAVFIASWLQNGRFADLRDDMRVLRDDMRVLRDDMNRGFDQISKRLERIEEKLDNHQGRIIALETRGNPPLVTR